MLAPSSDYRYTSSAMRYDQQQQQQQQPSDGHRPNLLMAPPYGHFMAHGVPQHTPLVKYEHSPYAPPPMLHVSSDYHTTGIPTTDAPPASNAKRSREELNQKEKLRMFKLNERISQLREVLDAAGVQTKKNKQSVLDNTAHFIEKLQTDLKIAQQKAERAEKQAESFRSQAPRGEKLLRRVFESSTPRLVLDMKMQTVTFNAAFVQRTGLAESTLKKKKNLRQYLCDDQEKLDQIVDQIRREEKSVGVQVTAGNAAVNLIAAAVTNDSGEAAHIEFSLIPLETRQSKRRKVAAGKRTAGKDSSTGDDSVKHESIYVQL